MCVVVFLSSLSFALVYKLMSLIVARSSGRVRSCCAILGP